MVLTLLLVRAVKLIATVMVVVAEEYILALWVMCPLLIRAGLLLKAMILVALAVVGMSMTAVAVRATAMSMVMLPLFLPLVFASRLLTHAMVVATLPQLLMWTLLRFRAALECLLSCRAYQSVAVAESRVARALSITPRVMMRLR